MKKAFVLIVLFALPVSVYIIFGTAVHNFLHLPILTEEIENTEKFTPLNEEEIQFDEFVTVLLIYGKDIKNLRGNAFNLNDRIYKKNHIYKDFQIVILAEDGYQEDAQNLLKELHDFTGMNISKWKFVFGSEEDIHSFFDSMKTDLNLNENNATPFAFLIDQEGNLRGRKKNTEDTDETIYGYETHSIASLNNTMVDDVNVLLAEYRFKSKREEEDFLKYNKENQE